MRSFLEHLGRRRRLLGFLLLGQLLVGAAGLLEPGGGLRLLAYQAALALGTAAAWLLRDWSKSAAARAELDRLTRSPEPVLGAELPEPPPGEDPAPLLLAARIRREAEAEVAARRAAAREDVEFLAAWVHELKTPVTALRLMAESGRLEAAEVLAELDRIEERLRKALGYARSSDFAADSRLAPLSLEAAVSAVLARLRRLFLGRGLSLELEGPFPEVSSDAKWLDFVLEQLLSNAAKYSPRGGRVRVRAEEGLEGANLLVEDEGPGIDPADLERVFSRGFTGRNGRADPGSTGLGLYLSRRLCERLGLGLSLEPREGGGLRARLFFPRLSDWHAPAAPGAAARGPAAGLTKR